MSGEGSLPEPDARVVAGSAVLAAPGEAFLAEAEVLGNGEDRIGKASLECVLVGVAHVVGLVPVEALVEVDVRCRGVAVGQTGERDVYVHEADVHANASRQLLPRERLVRRDDVLVRDVPRRAKLADCGREKINK